MAMVINALREKVRRKELYIAAAIGVLILVAFCSGVGTISFNGVPITDYKMLIPILLVVVNVVSGALAIILSLKTIPNEYERHTSHLIWIRGISQVRYHGALALANAISSVLATAIMYGCIAIFTVVKGEAESLILLVPSFLLLSMSVVIVSLVTSLLSIKLPPMAAGLIATLFLGVGMLQSVLSVMQNLMDGLVSGILRVLLMIVPDLHVLQTQAGNVIKGVAVDVHIIFKGLLIIYVLTLLFFVLKRKEA